MNRHMRHFSHTVATTLVLASVVTVQAPAQAIAAEEYTVPASGVFQIAGRGWGHGLGLSQYGALQAARQGLSHERILSFYYPGATIASLPADRDVRVLLQGASGPEMVVRAAAGLMVRYTAKGSQTPTVVPLVVPTPQAVPPVAGSAGCLTAITRVRVVATAQGLRVDAECGAWQPWIGGGAEGATGTVAIDPAFPVRLSGPEVLGLVTSKRTGYRGALVAQRLSAGALRVTNELGLETYLRTVVPSEISSTWPGAALRAQAVAARSYALSEMGRRAAKPFDVYDTTVSQYYPGAFGYSSDWRVLRSAERTSSDAAVVATRGKYLSSGGVPALAMFSSSNGGLTLGSSAPYLVNRTDPYDASAALNARRAWTDTVSAATLESKYPSIGRLKAIRVLSRTGLGLWGGRMTAIELVGTAGRWAIKGSENVRNALGTNSSYMTLRAPGLGGWVRPVPGPKIVSFGKAGRLWSLGYHTGIDLDSKIDVPVVAAADGVVVTRGVTGPYGLHVLIRHRDGIETLYGHMNAIQVAEGDVVLAGQRLGLSGTTGNSTGPHVHFEIRVGGVPADPAPWLNGAAVPAPQPSMINPVYLTTPLLAPGTQGPWAKKLQTLLGITPAGYYGATTRSALLAFKKANGLPADGLVTPETWAALLAPRPTPTPSAISTPSAAPTASKPPTPTPTPSAVKPSPKPTAQKPVGAPRGSAGALLLPGTVRLPLIVGSTGIKTRWVQARLGQPTTGTYSKATAKAVVKFQTRAKLTSPRQAVTGQVDARTWKAMFQPPPSALKRGDHGAYVSVLQARMLVDVTGYFGPKTLKAVKATQKRYGMAPTGTLTPAQWARIIPAR